jgi:hypothetical protein
MMLHFRTTDCPIQEFLRIKRRSFRVFPESYLRMAESLNMDLSMLRKCVPIQTIESWQSSVLAVLEEAKHSNKDEDYLQTLISIKRILAEMHPALVDQEALLNLNDATKSRLSSLIASGASHRPISYSNSGSVTGRLTVVSGPNVLTMPSDYKRMLKSRFDGGRILQIDLIAAEPTIALNIVGKPPEADPYMELSETIFRSKLDRNACKKVVLCALYGQSKKKLSEVIGDGLNAKDIIESTKKYFDYDGLLSLIRESAEEDLLTRNFFGRPLLLPDSSESIAVSYFLQSTAAEAAILAFGDLLERTRDHCIPLHVVHDALLVDCKEDYAEFLLRKERLRLRLNNWVLPAKVSYVA